MSRQGPQLLFALHVRTQKIREEKKREVKITVNQISEWEGKKIKGDKNQGKNVRNSMLMIRWVRQVSMKGNEKGKDS